MYYSTSNCIFTNLAIEQKLLMEVPRDKKILFLYRNNPCGVMGRFQNPWQELNLPFLIGQKIPVARRQSGGGTVFHDLGNLNFSFIQGTRDHQKDTNNQIVIQALKSLGIEAYSSDRSDLMVEFNGQKKISGSAFKQKKDRSIHHGTLLINSELDLLRSSLKTPFNIIESKSTASNPNSVVNLQEIQPSLKLDHIIERLQQSFSDFIGVVQKIKHLDETQVDLSYKKEIEDLKWIFGETPEFRIQIAKDNIELDLVIKKGNILKSDVIWEEYPLYQKTVAEALLKFNRIYGDKPFEKIINFIQNEIGTDKVALEKIINFLRQTNLF